MANEMTTEQLVTDWGCKTITVKVPNLDIRTPCLICGEGVPVFSYEISPKICEKCKVAVMKVRNEDGSCE